ncbi:MAG: tRNA dihydrouridine synthase DusB [Gammaproteobacteria bacterium]|nr:tRNA dihydrouridine synthase DusB [Thiotrichales bacterium]OUX54065.1 MAG: tRNA dihydrouridine synthase DusB [Methylococcaceae bacterium TMED282]|tara:strand:- start:834 stop:1808 length:975 start_codon:yes stop_codon:yes gene_type:complete
MTSSNYAHKTISLAPMAGISDLPFRTICRELGADYATSEMIASRTELWGSVKSKSRLCFHDEVSPRVVQLVGSDPQTMALAASMAEANGADVVDINMGCPAKKVCGKAAGSALLRDENLVRRILDAVISAVDIPVTLKIRTGWDANFRNGVTIASIAERAGISSLAVHGRTRACGFTGIAEHGTVAQIKTMSNIRIVGNGDIVDLSSAKKIFDETGVDGIMLGRAARGNPWIFSEIRFGLEGKHWKPPTMSERLQVMLRHLRAIHGHYGLNRGARIARKHIGWYLGFCPDGQMIKKMFNTLSLARDQIKFLLDYEESLYVEKNA